MNLPLPDFKHLYNYIIIFRFQIKLKNNKIFQIINHRSLSVFSKLRKLSVYFEVNIGTIALKSLLDTHTFSSLMYAQNLGRKRKNGHLKSDGSTPETLKKEVADGW